MDDEDAIGFHFFLDLSFKKHCEDFPNDKISFKNFSSICSTNWENLDEDARKKIILIAQKEQDEKPNISIDDIDTDIDDLQIITNALNMNNILSIGEDFKKNFSLNYTYSKRNRSAYIYFFKAARLDLKDQVSCTKNNFTLFAKVISKKWNELKPNEKKLFDEIAVLDKRFNCLGNLQNKKKKENLKHTPLFLKAKEARDQLATSSGISTIKILKTRKTTKTKRKVKRKRKTKKIVRKKTTTKTQKVNKTTLKSSIKRIKIKRE